MGKTSLKEIILRLSSVEAKPLKLNRYSYRVQVYGCDPMQGLHYKSLYLNNVPKSLIYRSQYAQMPAKPVYLHALLVDKKKWDSISATDSKSRIELMTKSKNIVYSKIDIMPIYMRRKM